MINYSNPPFPVLSSVLVLISLGLVKVSTTTKISRNADYDHARHRGHLSQAPNHVRCCCLLIKSTQ